MSRMTFDQMCDEKVFMHHTDGYRTDSNIDPAVFMRKLLKFGKQEQYREKAIKTLIHILWQSARYFYEEDDEIKEAIVSLFKESKVTLSQIMAQASVCNFDPACLFKRVDLPGDYDEEDYEEDEDYEDYEEDEDEITEMIASENEDINVCMDAFRYLREGIIVDDCDDYAVRLFLYDWRDC